MGLLGLVYLFPGQLPTCAAIVEHISSLAEETISVEAIGDAGQVLTCPAMGDEWVLLEAVAQNGQWAYRLASLVLGGSYLVDATITVLRAAGGRGEPPKYDLSGRSWRDGKTLYRGWL